MYQGQRFSFESRIQYVESIERKKKGSEGKSLKCLHLGDVRRKRTELVRETEKDSRRSEIELFSGRTWFSKPEETFHEVGMNT